VGCSSSRRRGGAGWRTRAANRAGRRRLVEDGLDAARRSLEVGSHRALDTPPGARRALTHEGGVCHGAGRGWYACPRGDDLGRSAGAGRRRARVPPAPVPRRGLRGGDGGGGDPAGPRALAAEPGAGVRARARSAASFAQPGADRGDDAPLRRHRLPLPPGRSSGSRCWRCPAALRALWLGRGASSRRPLVSVGIASAARRPRRAPRGGGGGSPLAPAVRLLGLLLAPLASAMGIAVTPLAGGRGQFSLPLPPLEEIGAQARRMGAPEGRTPPTGRASSSAGSSSSATRWRGT